MSKWERVRLGGVSKLISGRDLVPEQYNDQNNGVPYITGASNINDGHVIINRWTTEPVVISNYDDILITCKGTVGLTAFNDFGICHLARQIMAIRADTNIVEKKYLKYAVDGSFQKLLRKARSMIPGVSREDILSLTLPLPPLDEQKRIADAFDKASELINKRKEQIRLMDELAKSLFIEMFGDPVENPMGWEMIKLETLTHKITDGVHAKPNYTELGMPFISVTNITKGYLNFEKCKYVSLEDYNQMIKCTFPEYGDILYTKVGATYGTPAFVNTVKKFCLYVSVCLIKPNQELINSKFLFFSMGMPYIKRQADKRIKGIGVPDLHLNQIREFDICYPPLPLQQIFADRIDAIEKQKALLQDGLTKMETAYKALMQEYFDVERPLLEQNT